MKKVCYCLSSYWSKVIVLFPLMVINLAIGYSQVNYQTGSAEFSLPIFDWADKESRLTSGIALNYSSKNGLKTGDVASNVGQGWDLLAGGVIVRMQVGEPDDQVPVNGSGSVKDINRIPGGYLYSSTSTSMGCPKTLTRYPIFKHKNQIYSYPNAVAEDRQLDFFAFQFNGKSGLFALSRTKDEGIPIGDTKLKITFHRSSNLGEARTSIDYFTIQDDNGLLYTFAEKGYTNVLRVDYATSDRKNLRTIIKEGLVYYRSPFEEKSYPENKSKIVSSWHLVEIKDPLTQRTVRIGYDYRSLDNWAGAEISYNQNGYAVVNNLRSKGRSADIKSITLPDGHRVEFEYGHQRQDLNGAYALSSINVLYNGRFVSKHVLNTTYVMSNRYGNPTTALQKSNARLYLKSVKKIGIDQKEDFLPYQFDYFLGSNAPDDIVPPPFHYAKDIWGYYNGDNSRAYDNSAIPLSEPVTELTLNQLRGLCYLNSGVTGININPKTGYAKNGLLRQITYPTGGTLSYEYEQNMGTINGSYRAVGGVHVKNTTKTDGGFGGNCGNQVPVVAHYNYVLTGGNSSLWGMEAPLNSMVENNAYAPERKLYKWNLSCLPFGCCYYGFMFPGILHQSQATDLNSFEKFMEIASPILGVLSALSTVSSVAVVLMASSVPPIVIVGLVVDVVVGLATLAITCLSDYSKNSTYTTYYNTDFNGVSSLPAQFKRLEIVHNGGETGKTIYEFTDTDDYPLWKPTNPALSSAQRFAPWAYGLPKNITVLDASGQVLHKTENEYDYTNAKNSNNNNVSCRCKINVVRSQRDDDWGNPAKYGSPENYTTQSNSDMDVELYQLYSGRVELKSSKEKIYNTANPGAYLQTLLSYEYGDNFEISKITSLKSDGTTTVREFKYSSDFSSGIFEELNELNIIKLPVATITYSSTNSTPQSEEVIEYTKISNGDIKPSRKLEQKSANYIPDFIAYQGPGSTDDYTYTLLESYQYDENGNLIGMRDEGGRRIANIYGYQNKFITASIINADPIKDKPLYTSFEMGEELLGGWRQNGNTIASNGNSVTGKMFFSLQENNNSLSADTLNVDKKYRLSFWATNSSLTVSAATILTPVATSQTAVNGYTYYEYEVPEGNSQLMITGTADIDELRLYPKNARMRTSVYEDLLGKISECDENNMITHYEYDNLGRVLNIKNGQGAILKMYEYNTASKASVCPKIYYSKLALEKIQRSDCGEGYVGGIVTYTVPANKYTSTVSQEDADEQVDLEIQTLGQAYANSNGVCKQIYYNTERTHSISTDNCGIGFQGGSVAYTVPAGQYSSLVSQQDADQQALDDVEANGQVYANSPENAICNPITDAEWIALEGDSASYCANVGGALPAHMFVMEKDENPHSPTFGSTRWQDVGPTTKCQAGVYYNTVQIGSFSKNDCVTGSGSTVVYRVPAGKYTSSVSLAAANQLAQDEINANGQDYANTIGTCVNDIMLNIYNLSNDPMIIRLWKLDTGETYFHTIPSNMYWGNPYYVQVPAGLYLVSLYQGDQYKFYVLENNCIGAYTVPGGGGNVLSHWGQLELFEDCFEIFLSDYY